MLMAILSLACSGSSPLCPITGRDAPSMSVVAMISRWRWWNQDVVFIRIELEQIFLSALSDRIGGDFIQQASPW